MVKFRFAVENSDGLCGKRNIKVYGTEFNVKRYSADRQLKATLVEGSIGFSNDHVAELKLQPGYQLSLTEGKSEPTVEKVKVYNTCLSAEGKIDEAGLKKAALAVKVATVKLGIHRELGLDSIVTVPYSEDDILRIENFAEELATENRTIIYNGGSL